MKKYFSSLLLFVLMFLPSLLVAQRQMEKLDRGLVAVRTSASQVFLSWRVLGSDPDNVAFNLYRGATKINATPIATATNYTDANAASTTYTVKTVINGVETGEAKTAAIWANNFLDVPLDVPATVITSDTTSYSYSPNDCSVGDADGDGEYEIFVKWEPSNAKDNSQSGYTGNVYLDCYKLNGTKLWRIDLGINIRAGAHYTDFEVEDFDGDGKAEIVCKTAPGTVDGLGNFLSKGPAATNTPALNAVDYRNSGGYILTGPEYLTCFSGLTGAELSTVSYNPPRGTVSGWGDSYGNRVDRFLACTAYLDGLHPSIVMCRGYYTRAVLAAWDYTKDKGLVQRWVYDSNSPNGANAAGQGNHNLSVGDIDDDGKDEIVYGASAFDDNGKCLYKTGLGHGDAMHLSDLDPDRKGLEVWEVHEDTSQPYGYEMHDAKTGAIIWGVATASDNGRGLAANVDASNRGFEMWSASGPGVSNCKGATINTSNPSMNFRIYWDGDLQDELLDKTSITKYGGGTLLSAAGCASNNGTKATPNLSADILGDWREEVIFRTSDNTRLRIFTTTIPTTNKLYTLMHDAQYRDAIAWQNAGYNQPPHLGFYMGDDMETAPVSAIYDNDKRWKSGTNWDTTTAWWEDSTATAATFKNGDKVLFDLKAAANAAVTVTGALSPSRIKMNSPYNVALSGTGTLNGSMDLKKIGAGVLTLNNNNNFTGPTTIWGGEFYNNGTLANSEVFVKPFVKIGGYGTFGSNVTLANLTTISPGSVALETRKLTIQKNLIETGTVAYNFDIKLSAAGQLLSNDTLVIGGDWKMQNKATFNITTTGATLSVGEYLLAKCSGTITGDIAKLKVTGVPTKWSYQLVNNGGNIVLAINKPAGLIWKGNVNSTWDNGKTANWLRGDSTDIFTSNDSVVFNDSTAIKTISISEAVIPSAVVVDAASSFVFGGLGNIQGTGGLTKNGAGKLTVYNSNTFTGKVTVNGGILEFGSLGNGGVASPIGAAANLPANILLNGGRLNFYGATATTDRGMTLGANGGTISITLPTGAINTTGKLTGAGKLTKEGAGTLGLSVASDFKGGTSINAGTISLLTDVANSTGLGAGGDTITFRNGTLKMFDTNTTSNTSNWKIVVPTGFTGTLNTDGKSTINGTITGGGTLNYYTNYIENILQSDASLFTGTINATTDLDGGYFSIYNTKGFPNAKINLNNLVTMMYRTTLTATIPIGELTGVAGSVLGAAGSGACTLTWEVGARNASSTFAGTITNAQYSGTGAIAAISKKGTGVWTLTGANTYTGGTTINEGTILVNNTTGSGLGTGAVTVNTGGTLGGTGFIAGSVSVKDGGILSPANGVGTLTINNNVSLLPNSVLAIDIDKSTSKNDLLNSTGTVTVAGKLQVTALNGTTFAIGDVFDIVDGTIIGAPSEVIPATPGEGLAWDLSEFTTSGKLKVTNSSGIENVNIQTSIYPNPFTRDVQISLGNVSSKVDVSIATAVGKLIASYQFANTSRADLNLSNLEKGVYLLTINTDSGTVTRKIVKE